MSDSSNQMRLLIIEDDRESADYLVKAFREVGHVAELASDGEEGLSLADGGDYDIGLPVFFEAGGGGIDAEFDFFVA